MKLTQQQKLWLQDYLGAVFSYREIYGEVYDHILSALEDRQLAHTFEGTVLNIIADDFGGSNGLGVLEENCKKGIEADVRAQYNSYFKWLKFPAIIYVIAIVLIVFYAVARVRHLFVMFIPAVIVHVFGFFLFAPIVFIALPICMLAVRGFKPSHLFGHVLASAKDVIFRRLAYRPIRLFFYCTFFETGVHFVNATFPHMPYTFVLPVYEYLLFAAVFLLPLIHAIAFYKVYKNEFKPDILGFAR